MNTNLKKYAENGVFISKDKIVVGDKVKLTYDGLLLKSGADNVFAHIGYGEQWDDKAFIPMSLVEGFFEAEFEVVKEMDLNISFKDSADNWDNNSSNNYTYSVTVKSKPAKKETAPKKASKTSEKEDKTKASKAPKAEKSEAVDKAKKTTTKTTTKETTKGTTKSTTKSTTKKKA